MDEVYDNNNLIVEEKIVLHRLPYMKMDPKISRNLSVVMTVIVFFFSISYNAIRRTSEVFGAFMASFNMFIYPGLFFYYANQERAKKAEDEDQCPKCESKEGNTESSKNSVMI